MFLPNALLKALAQVRPEAAMAEGSGAVWTMQVNGNHPDGSPFITAMFTYAGGVGAHATKPGLSACSYPTGVSAVPIEVVEASAPIRFSEKSLRPGSGGRGAQIGGLGPIDRVQCRHRKALAAKRCHQPPSRPSPRRVRRRSGRRGQFQGQRSTRTDTGPGSPLEGSDVVRLELPGGGGYGAPDDA